LEEQEVWYFTYKQLGRLYSDHPLIVLFSNISGSRVGVDYYYYYYFSLLRILDIHPIVIVDEISVIIVTSIIYPPKAAATASYLPSTF